MVKIKILNSLARKLFDKDTQTLIEAGVLSDSLDVLKEQFVLRFIVAKYKKEMATEAQEIIDLKKGL